MNLMQFKMIFRGWFRNKTYTVVSLLSLIVGLACSVLLIGFTMNEYRISRSVSDGQVFFITSSDPGNEDIKYFQSSVQIPVELQQLYPEVESYCVFRGCGESVILRDGEPIRTGKYYSVLPEYVDFFKPVVLVGDLRQTLSVTNQLAVSESCGRRLFGNASPIGQTMEIAFRKYIPNGDQYGHWEDAQATYTVTAVFADLKGSMLDCEMLQGLSRDGLTGWENQGVEIYSFLKLRTSVPIADFVAKVNRDSAQVQQMGAKLELMSMEQAYFTPTDYSYLTKSRDKSFLYISLSVALAILLIACFNYVNINMTRMLQHMQNTGRQMVCGATKSTIRMQLFAEAFMQVVFAFVVALLLIYEILPVFNSFLDSELQIGDLFRGGGWGVLAALLLLITLLPSLYLFAKLGNVRLDNLLRRESLHKTKLIKWMVIAQFSVAIVLMIVVLNIHRQMDYIAHSRPNADDVVSVNPPWKLNDTKAWYLFKERLASLPDVKAVTATKITQNMSGTTDHISYRVFDCDDAYFEVYGVKVLQGEALLCTAIAPAKEGEAVQGGTVDRVLVNEAFVRALGSIPALGYTFEFWNGEPRTVVGVVADFPVDNFSRKIPPMVFCYNANGVDRLVVKTDGKDIVAMKGKLNALWKEVNPENEDLLLSTMADVYRKFHAADMRIMQVVWVFMWISLLLTALGLFGLAWYSVSSRIKEIGLRKIHGATECQVMVLVCGRFIVWIVFAFVIAVPIAFYFSDHWLQQFVYRAGLTTWTYVAAGVFALSVGMLTVLWQSWHAATTNPVESLKSE